jgi:hypothetical protein
MLYDVGRYITSLLFYDVIYIDKMNLKNKIIGITVGIRYQCSFRIPDWAHAYGQGLANSATGSRLLTIDDSDLQMG